MMTKLRNRVSVGLTSLRFRLVECWITVVSDRGTTSQTPVSGKNLILEPLVGSLKNASLEKVTAVASLEKIIVARLMKFTMRLVRHSSSNRRSQISREIEYR